ncbi:MAG: homocysteine S-methyltransferase family protein [Oscillospiraceae bacterium]|nr:homocysteine S-methyltransferase family protein [Oscillospiraceae bacterium]
MEFRELLRSPAPVLLDGGMGTMLQARGLKPGEYPELAALDHPDWLFDIHRAYVDAGARIISANTFGANREKLSRMGKTVAEVVSASVCVAREAADHRALVALDVGPIGQLLEPTGLLQFEQAVDIFKEVISAGVDAGVDLIFIETVADLQEARAALLAAKEVCSLPVMVTMTYEERGRTFLGHSPAAAALTLEGLGADAIGVNCSLGPREMPPLARELLKWSTLPIILKPNAGLPDPNGGGYDITAAQFASTLASMAELGVKLFGGCCGTTPEYIALLKQELSGRQVAPVERAVPAAVCSPTTVVPIDRVRVIGERINPTGKKLMKEALRRGDVDFMLSQALAQTQAGADILDVNVGLPEIDEGAMMVRTVKALQGITDAPLQIDSTDPAVLERALRVYCGKAIVNSVNGEGRTLSAILPIVKKYGASVVGLTLDENGIPKSAEARLAIAGRILDAALAHGIRKEDVYIDCLTLTASAEQECAAQTLQAVRMVKEQLGLKTVLGVSNISFGLPARSVVNQNFLTMAMVYGLDLPIINPNTDSMMAAVRSFHLLMNVDADARDFIAAYANATVSTAITTGSTAAAPAPTAARTLDEIVRAGLRGEAGPATRALLEGGADSMDIINTMLIPALDAVGAEFEAGRQFLPQLIQSAGAAQAAFEVLREHMSSAAADTDTDKNTIILATVKGDIHDIGKNIAKVLLENYGFAVIDLGKDVPPEAVVQAVREHGAGLVGLSALMTTTLKSMADTIALLHKENLPCKIMVGGAVLTEDYAKRIGADFYARDAKQGVDIARSVFGAS